PPVGALRFRFELARRITAIETGGRRAVSNLANDAIHALFEGAHVLEGRNIDRHDELAVTARNRSIDHVAKLGSKSRAREERRKHAGDNREPGAFEGSDRLQQTFERGPGIRSGASQGVESPALRNRQTLLVIDADLPV